MNKRHTQHEHKAIFFRWTEQLGPRLRTLLILALAAAGGVSFLIGLESFLMGAEPTVARYNPKLFGSGHEVLYHWVFVCWWLGVSVLFWAIAIAIAVWLRNQKLHFGESAE